MVPPVAASEQLVYWTDWIGRLVPCTSLSTLTGCNYDVSVDRAFLFGPLPGKVGLCLQSVCPSQRGCVPTTSHNDGKTGLHTDYGQNKKTKVCSISPTGSHDAVSIEGRDLQWIVSHTPFESPLSGCSRESRQHPPIESALFAWGEANQTKSPSHCTLWYQSRVHQRRAFEGLSHVDFGYIFLLPHRPPAVCSPHSSFVLTGSWSALAIFYFHNPTNRTSGFAGASGPPPGSDYTASLPHLLGSNSELLKRPSIFFCRRPPHPTKNHFAVAAARETAATVRHSHSHPPKLPTFGPHICIFAPHLPAHPPRLPLLTKRPHPSQPHQRRPRLWLRTSRRHQSQPSSSLTPRPS